jgi:hypothetical protein
LSPGAWPVDEPSKFHSGRSLIEVTFSFRVCRREMLANDVWMIARDPKMRHWIVAVVGRGTSEVLPRSADVGVRPHSAGSGPARYVVRE